MVCGDVAGAGLPLEVLHVLPQLKLGLLDLSDQARQRALNALHAGRDTGKGPVPVVEEGAPESES